MRLVDKDKLLEELIEGQKAGLGLIWGSKYANINSIDDAIETVDYADEIDLKEHDLEIRADERRKCFRNAEILREALLDNLKNDFCVDYDDIRDVTKMFEKTWNEWLEDSTEYEKEHQ